MLENLPAKGVLKAVELERQMIKADLEHKRTLPIKEAHSILIFCFFLTSAANGTCIPPIALPFQHVTFYRKTVARLVGEGVLPFEAKQQFDATFSVQFLRALKAA